MPIAVVVCTIGGRLEHRVAGHTAAGACARAMILDAVGSAAVEEVADRTSQMICDYARRDGGFAPAPRQSPGYGAWSLDEQRLIFELLAPHEIGVTLSASRMMVPRKTVSYVVPLRGGDRGARSAGRCVRCGCVDCLYREEWPVEPAMRREPSRSVRESTSPPS